MPEVELSGDDCSNKSSSAHQSVSGKAFRRYFFASSRMEQTKEATAEAKAKAEAAVLSKVTSPTCTPPCKPFMMFSNFDYSVDIDEGTTFLSGFVPWMGHYWLEVTYKITCDVVVGCSK